VPGKALVITSGKGGVGKTTTTANLGLGLALRGHKVALVDADTGLRNLDVVMGLENRIVYDLVDVIEGFGTSAPATWCSCLLPSPRRKTRLSRNK
jgi:septum site-determining protein MinD